MFLSYYASTFHNKYFIIFIDIIKISDHDSNAIFQKS